MTYCVFAARRAATLVIIALVGGTAIADEHASHHPGAAAASTASMPDQPQSPPAAGGGMADMMGKMMAPMGSSAMPAAAGSPAAPATVGAPGAVAPIQGDGMAGMPTTPGSTGSVSSTPTVAPAGGCGSGGCGSGAAKTPIYSTLMTLPSLTPDKRAEIDALATQQMSEGKTHLVTGLDALNRAAEKSDSAAMQQSVGTMHEGLDELGAGIAARRVLAEGKAPRNLALDWFKREMNLASPIVNEETEAGIATPFHILSMGLLVTFAISMLLMYFYKMRRAASLFGRGPPDPPSPPPGLAPSLDGGVASSVAAHSAAASVAASPPARASGSGPPQSFTDAGTALTIAAQPSNSSSTPTARSAADSAPDPVPTIPISTSTASVPVAAIWRGQLRISSIVTETPTVKTFRLVYGPGIGPLPFTFVPGQFMNVAFWIGGAKMNRSYSISSSPTQRNYLELTIRREPRGAVSRHIDDLLKVGDAIEVSGPVGRFTFTGSEDNSIVLIAGGVGITPMVSIVRYLTERLWGGDIYLFYACKTPKDFIFARDLTALQRANPHLHLLVTMSGADATDWTGPRGRLTKELFELSVPNLASRRIHLCGPPTMMDAARTILADLGIPATQVRTESFGAVKPTPAEIGTSAARIAPATGPLVTFSKNHKSAKIHLNQTILELSEELAIGIEFSCRVGTCGVCKTKMTAGEVDMAVEDALDADDKAHGIILACQAIPRMAVSVEA